jgi:uncharacterized membrane protein (UPF0127 family)
VIVENRSRRQVLMSHGRWASGFWDRLRGLMGQPQLLAGDGLILVGDRSIHSFFMRFPIDVVYANRGWQVVHLDLAMGPNRIGPFVRPAAYVLELPAGVIHNTGTAVGDQLVCHTDAI